VVESQEVLAQLERMLASACLAPAPSLCRFLRYVVEETLAGRSALLKEYSIGTAVFSRGEKFSPRTDPIVRVQARNLRTRIEQYYAGPGVADPIRIDLPKGAYVPVFEQRQVAAPARKWVLSAVIAVAALLAIVSAAILETQRLSVHHGSGTPRQYLSP
jgi:hypothetical protein